MRFEELEVMRFEVERFEGNPLMPLQPYGLITLCLKTLYINYFKFLRRLVIVTLSSMIPRSSLIFTRFCSIVSRKRSVTVSS